MKRQEAFTRGNVGRPRLYDWQKVLDEGGVWTLRAGEDYRCTDKGVANAAYMWARRRGFTATAYVVEPGVVEIAITRKSDA